MINNIPNNIGNINNVIANERRLYNERSGQLQVFEDRLNNKNENKEALYDDVKRMDESLHANILNLRQFSEEVIREVHTNEERRIQVNDLKQTVKEPIKRRARDLNIQLLNKYVNGIEKELTRLKRCVLNLKELEEQVLNDGYFDFKDEVDVWTFLNESKKASKVCDIITTYYIKKIATILKLVKNDVDENNYKKMSKLEDVIVD